VRGCQTSLYGRWGPCPTQTTHQTAIFCKSGHVITSTQEIAFRQWTDKGYVFCRTTIPIGVCDRCGSRHWNEDAEAIIQDVVRQEYRKLV
jgi:hypothetical protein